MSTDKKYGTFSIPKSSDGKDELMSYAMPSFAIIERNSLQDVDPEPTTVLETVELAQARLSKVLKGHLGENLNNDSLALLKLRLHGELQRMQASEYLNDYKVDVSSEGNVVTVNTTFMPQHPLTWVKNPYYEAKKRAYARGPSCHVTGLGGMFAPTSVDAPTKALFLDIPLDTKAEVSLSLDTSLATGWMPSPIDA